MKRKDWLDYMKFVAMSLVVFHHSPPRYDNTQEVALVYVGMPMFFFAAGYLFNISKQQDFWTFLRHRAKKILIPYTTFFILFYALWLVVGRSMVGSEEMAINRLTPLWQFLTGRPDIVVAPFWFLAAMFTMQLIYYPIRRYTSGYWPLIISLLLCLSLFILPDWSYFRCWNFDRALLYLPLYAFGNCCKDLIDSFETPFVIRKGIPTATDAMKKHPLTYVLMVVCAVAGMTFHIYAPSSITVVAYVLAPMAAILFIPLYVTLCKWLEAQFGSSRVAKNVALTGITFLGFQNYLIGIFKILVTKLFGADTLNENILWKFGIAIVVMIILYPLALIVERYFPWLLGKKSKKNSNFAV